MYISRVRPRSTARFKKYILYGQFLDSSFTTRAEQDCIGLSVKDDRRENLLLGHSQTTSVKSSSAFNWPSVRSRWLDIGEHRFQMFLHTSISSWSIKTQKKESNIQPSRPNRLGKMIHYVAIKKSLFFRDVLPAVLEHIFFSLRRSLNV